MGGGAGFGMLRRPILWGEGYAPEGGAGVGEFEAYFGFAVAHGAQEYYVAFLLFFGAFVS